jgi:transcription-repair coupling factor (superfamily II helicase)
MKSKGARDAPARDGNTRPRRRIEEILREYDVAIPRESIRVGKLSGGFEIPSARLEVLTETDIFGEVQHADLRQLPAYDEKRTSSVRSFGFSDLKSGDYVVHVRSGIGRFESLQTIDAGGASREFMLLIYAEDSKLFVPVERLDLVSRYSIGEAALPVWTVSADSAGRRQRPRQSVRCAIWPTSFCVCTPRRKLVQGYAFSADTPWQQEFEDAFPFELTVDQASAIEDVKEDMETARPMDRLIIGDVGYGKTEVAMRAAFKA